MLLIYKIFSGIILMAFTPFYASSASPSAPILECALTTTKPTSPLETIPMPPIKSGSSRLPSPIMTLAHIAVGRGIQNYTCTGPGAAPVAIGAVATLYDATSLAYFSENCLHQVPPRAVYLPLPPPTFTHTSQLGFLSFLGHHFFDAAGTPVFDLSAKKSILFAEKKASIKAPLGANKGPAKTGAVDWLFLTDKGGKYTSIGLSQVYRVVTAGGIGPTCLGTGVETVEYAAEYWFYK
ncbi:hypothetical protein BKA64DRAFT_655089 [Cadophora sp. MPI-SDFR-AT-0126]|nr:hypothetical protein BKA64DRAFT_655089 [Leotiomycetes sp. MPI-SDFR-AT-0126]